ncbi:MAG: hypothetical protein AB7F99_11740 [Vicinamibacterales bacterium]
MAAKKSGRDAHRRQKRVRFPKAVKWAAVLAVVGLIVYAVSQSSGIAYDEEDIGVVDFSSLTSEARTSVLQEANRARCPCGCGMNLAQCVSIDSTCPIRDRNIERIRGMVRAAG